jgi:hypothetical protein
MVLSYYNVNQHGRYARPQSRFRMQGEIENTSAS